MQRNRYYSPRSTAWASEGERSHAGLKVFETRCQGAIRYASLAENVLSGDKNRRYVSRNLTAGRTLLSSLYVCSGRNCWKKVSSRKPLTYRRLLSTTASFSARWAEGREPDGVLEAKRSQGQQPLRQTCSRQAPRLFFASASYEQLVPCRCIGPRRRNLRLRAFPASALCEQLAALRLPRCGLTQAVFCPLSRCCRAVPRRPLACRLSRTRRA